MLPVFFSDQFNLHLKYYTFRSIMKIPLIFLKCLTLSLWIACQSAAIGAEARSTKDIWLDYSGANFCQKNYCADGIPALLLKEALNFFVKNQGLIKNDDYLTIIDFTKPSTEKRMFILNLKDGSVEKLLVTHGKNTEGELAQAKFFSNTPGTNMSSLGFFITDQLPYIGKHGISLRLTGLSETNSNARKRNIVIHGAPYATQWFVEYKGRLGLSQGCPAIDPERIEDVIAKLKGESLLYIYSDQPTN